MATLNSEEVQKFVYSLKARQFSINSNLKFGQDYIERIDPNSNLINNEIEKQKEYLKETEKVLEFLQEITKLGTYQTIEEIINKLNKNRKPENEFLITQTVNWLKKFKPKQEVEKLLNDERKNCLLIELNKIYKTNFDLRIDDNLDDLAEKYFEIKGKLEQQDTNIAILGRRGVGKSTLVNTFFNKMNFDDDAIKTGGTETTLYPHSYNNKFFNIKDDSFDKIQIWDYPGADTDNFPIDEYIEVVKNLPVDAFIYLFKSSFSEIDRKIIENLKNENRNFFLVRTNADTDLEKEPIMKLIEDYESKMNSFEDLKDVDKKMSSLWVKHKAHAENDSSIKDYLAKAGSDFKLYYISCSNLYRQFFDFPDLLSDLISTLPDSKKQFLLKNFHIKSSIFLAWKCRILKEFFEDWAVFLLVLFDKDIKKFNTYLVKIFLGILLTYGFSTLNEELPNIIPNEILEKNPEIWTNIRETVGNLSAIIQENAAISDFLKKNKKIATKLRTKHANLEKTLIEDFKDLSDSCLRLALLRIMSND